MDFINDINIAAWFSDETLRVIINILLTLIIGFIAIRLINFILSRFFLKPRSQHARLITTKAVTITGVVLIIMIIFSQLGMKLSAILGTAGIVGIVIGIASQTTIGNIISGIFLISEKSVEVGNLIRIGDHTGTVYSIDLLAIRLKTFDNLLIRIPNQTIISTELVNISKFPIRRLNIDLSVAYKEDLEKVHEVLKKVANDNPLCLDEPEPLFLIKNFGDNGIEILFGVWFERTNLVAIKNSILKEIKVAFDKEGVEIPFPHRTIYTGAVTTPFPVEVKEKNDNAEQEQV